MTNPKIADKQRIDYIDLLRILAITAVASFHFLYSAIVNHKTPNLLPSPLFEFARYGYLGVKLFFMISGYVIAVCLAQFIMRVEAKVISLFAK